MTHSGHTCAHTRGNARANARANTLILLLLGLLLAAWLLPVRAAWGAGVAVSLSCELRDSSWVREPVEQGPSGAVAAVAASRGGAPGSQAFYRYWNECGHAGFAAGVDPTPALVLSFRAKAAPAAAAHHPGLLGALGLCGR